jgi:hypothetical protein
MRMDSTGILRNRISMLGDEVTAKRSLLTGSFDQFMVSKGAVSTTNASNPKSPIKIGRKSFLNPFKNRIHRTTEKSPIDDDNVDVLTGKINF